MNRVQQSRVGYSSLYWPIIRENIALQTFYFIYMNMCPTLWHEMYLSQKVLEKTQFEKHFYHQFKLHAILETFPDSVTQTQSVFLWPWTPAWQPRSLWLQSCFCKYITFTTDSEALWASIMGLVYLCILSRALSIFFWHIINTKYIFC